MKRLDYLRAFYDVQYFAEHFFPEYIKRPVRWGKHHPHIFNAIKTGERGIKTNVICPRGAGKSTALSVIYPCHCIFFKEEYERRGWFSDSYILIICKSEELAIERIRNIAVKIENDSAFNRFKGSETWRTRHLVTSHGVQLKPLGRRGLVRGQVSEGERPSLIIGDDVDDAEEVQNPDIRRANQLWWDSDVAEAGAPEGTTNFISVDTVKHEEAIVSVLRGRTEWENHFYRAIEHPKDIWHDKSEDLWKEWEKIYTDHTLPPRERRELSDAFYDEHSEKLTEGVEELWPGMLTYLNIRRKVCDRGYFPVLREMQNSTRDPSKEIFDMEVAVRYDVTEDGFLRDDKRLVSWNDMSGATLFLDTMGGKDTVDNSFACAVLVVWEPMPGTVEEKREDDEKPHPLSKTYGYVYDCWLDRVKPTEQIYRAFCLLRDAQGELALMRGDSWKFAIELVPKDTYGLIKQTLLDEFKLVRAEMGIDVVLDWVPRNINKIDRIMPLEPAITHGWLSFNRKLSGEFYRQMRQFPNGDYLDAPDALQGATEIRVSMFEEERVARRERRARRAEAAAGIG